jgi:hypothetical protein
MFALETAIEQVEADLAANAGLGNVAATTRGAVEILPPARTPHPVLDEKAKNEPTSRPQLSQSVRRWSPAMLAAILLCFGVYALLQRVSSDVPDSNSEVYRNISHEILMPDLPLPTAFGVYALIDGKLIELEALSKRVPDRGPLVTSTFTRGGRPKLAHGRLQFVAFRRDLANSAPEIVSVRGLTAPKLQGSTENRAVQGFKEANASGARSISYEMKVAPIVGNPAMIVIRSADVNFALPAGDYILALKGIAYSFTVGGASIDASE